jgi:hypothetical protein
VPDIRRSAAIEAHALIDALPVHSAWRFSAAAVKDRLHELVDHPARLRQGTLNLCGPAAVCHVWLRRDPVAAVRFATTLFARGSATIGALTVRPSARLLGASPPPWVPEADFLLLAALRDSANRVLPYRPGGWEPAAGMTLPGAVTRWLSALGIYASIRAEAHLLMRPGLPHAISLAPGPLTDVLLFVSQSRLAARPDRRVPDHWIVLRAPIVATDATVWLRYWSWGRSHSIMLDRREFARGYFGAVIASATAFLAVGDQKTVASPGPAG